MLRVIDLLIVRISTECPEVSGGCGDDSRRRARGKGLRLLVIGANPRRDSPEWREPFQGPRPRAGPWASIQDSFSIRSDSSGPSALVNVLSLLLVVMSIGSTKVVP
jgi:hypothetical protein